ncbi:uncharacterized protein LAESUDRAFT_374642 [Laetiporus sulphureus 93-53]|uniref:Uncharacterized protein n=1 Tax=Laetiporus sulphureus 93-53 TaxID=1314785 RepID=A0A165CNS5_9APHY|nr:uncharacterized protein LAESUDRAFT_374642 [Laetiporus sulphureus 93-53]KZT03143.1 hypothetical protein LAESUDRAFT_374642 [Laetiporus sulphureus 93-53]
MLATDILKSVSLVLTWLALYVGFTPPCPPVSKGDMVYRGQLFELIVMVLITPARLPETIQDARNVSYWYSALLMPEYHTS